MWNFTSENWNYCEAKIRTLPSSSSCPSKVWNKLKSFCCNSNFLLWLQFSLVVSSCLLISWWDDPVCLSVHACVMSSRRYSTVSLCLFYMWLGWSFLLSVHACVSLGGMLLFYCQFHLVRYYLCPQPVTPGQTDWEQLLTGDCNHMDNLLSRYTQTILWQCQGAFLVFYIYPTLLCYLFINSITHA